MLLQKPPVQTLVQQSFPSVQTEPGGRQSIDSVQTSLMQAPEQQGAPAEVEQANPVSMHMAPGPDSGVSASVAEPSSTGVGSSSQLHPETASNRSARENRS